jgi:hypothetical protein
MQSQNSGNDLKAKEVSNIALKEKKKDDHRI